MRVKDLLLAALSRANHIEDGTAADSRELNKARAHFNSALSTYSDANFITAFQKTVDLTAKTEQVLGKYNLKKGLVMHFAPDWESLPDPERLAPGKDYAEYFTSRGERNIAYIITVVYDEVPVKEWRPATGFGSFEIKLRNLEICDYVPDLVVSDIERIAACMVKPSDEPVPYRSLDFSPQTTFYTDQGDDVYCAFPAGDNKVKLLLPECLSGWKVKVVYNSSMKFKDNDYIELPEVYRELLTLAVTVALLSEDADSDPTQLNNYSRMLERIENQVMMNNANTRRIVRRDEKQVRPLYTGQFISRRLFR